MVKLVPLDALCSQMQASALIPAMPFLIVGALEALTGSVLYLQTTSGALAVAALVFVLALAPRLLLDMQMRVLLRPRIERLGNKPTEPADADKAGKPQGSTVGVVASAHSEGKKDR